MDGCMFIEESLLRWYGGYCDRMDFRVDWDPSFDISHLRWGRVYLLLGIHHTLV
jgi:hypothetical protein